MDDETRRTAEAFACQVLGLDGVSEGRAPVGSVVWRLEQLEREYAEEGRSEAEFSDAAQIILRSGPIDPETGR